MKNLKINYGKPLSHDPILESRYEGGTNYPSEKRGKLIIFPWVKQGPNKKKKIHYSKLVVFLSALCFFGYLFGYQGSRIDDIFHRSTLHMIGLLGIYVVYGILYYTRDSS